MKKIFITIFLIFTFVAITIPALSYAEDPKGFFDYNQGERGFVYELLGCEPQYVGGAVVDECQISNVGRAIIRFVNLLIAFSALEAIFIILGAGYHMFVASYTGSEETYETGKKNLSAAIIGTIIIMVAYITINTVYTGLNLGGEDCSWTAPFKQCGATTTQEGTN